MSKWARFWGRVYTRRYWITNQIEWLPQKDAWAIENNLHWQLDVSFDADKLKARMNHAAQNLGIMRRMVFNTLKQEQSKGSLKGKRKRAGWSEEYLMKLLGILFKF